MINAQGLRTSWTKRIFDEIVSLIKDVIAGTARPLVKAKVLEKIHIY
jgi:hypothetical protein